MIDRSTLDQVFGEDAKTTERYVDILIDRGIAWGLLGPREADSIWPRHILNSAAVRELVPEGTTVVDVGSGAGLPGIPLALSRPDLEVVLLEPLLRRVTFLQGVIDELGLAPRVTVCRGRAEDHGVRYETVLSRAVAPLSRLIGWCAPLRTDGGQLLAMKGSSAEREVTEARPVLAEHELAAQVITVGDPAGAGTATVVRMAPRRPR